MRFDITKRHSSPKNDHLAGPETKWVGFDPPPRTESGKKSPARLRVKEGKACVVEDFENVLYLFLGKYQGKRAYGPNGSLKKHVLDTLTKTYPKTIT